jgi:hypothetical protein
MVGICVVPDIHTHYSYIPIYLTPAAAPMGDNLKYNLDNFCRHSLKMLQYQPIRSYFLEKMSIPDSDILN